MSEMIQLESSHNGQKVNVFANSTLHQHLRQHDNGQTWKPAAANTRTSSVAVGVEIRDGKIVRAGEAMAVTGRKPRHAQGVKVGVQEAARVAPDALAGQSVADANA